MKKYRGLAAPALLACALALALTCSPSVNAQVQNLNARDFGAVGDGKTDDRAALQKAIDKCAETGCQLLIPDGVYMLSVTPFGSRYRGIASLQLKSNVQLKGQSRDRTILRTQAHAYGKGALYRAISSDDRGVLKNASISNLTIDGDLANQTPDSQACNILLYVSEDLTISGIKSINANGQAIQVAGTTTAALKNIVIADNIVDNASHIGIQVAQFDGIKILNNQVSNTPNNSIDIYGDDGTTTSHGSNFLISGNHVSNSAVVGIFLETVRDGVVRDNTVQSAVLSAIAVNRIHGRPENILIEKNRLLDSGAGLFVVGDTGGVKFQSNEVAGFRNAGIQLGLASGSSVSGLSARDNRFSPVAGARPPIVLTLGHQAANCDIIGNSIVTSDLAGYPTLSKAAAVHSHVVVSDFSLAH
jgi:parallel beta-helix repeat protein